MVSFSLSITTDNIVDELNSKDDALSTVSHDTAVSIDEDTRTQQIEPMTSSSKNSSDEYARAWIDDDNSDLNTVSDTIDDSSMNKMTHHTDTISLDTFDNAMLERDLMGKVPLGGTGLDFVQHVGTFKLVKSLKTDMSDRDSFSNGKASNRLLPLFDTIPNGKQSNRGRLVEIPSSTRSLSSRKLCGDGSVSNWLSSPTPNRARSSTVETRRLLPDVVPSTYHRPNSICPTFYLIDGSIREHASDPDLPNEESDISNSSPLLSPSDTTYERDLYSAAEVVNPFGDIGEGAAIRTSRSCELTSLYCESSKDLGAYSLATSSNACQPQLHENERQTSCINISDSDFLAGTLSNLQPETDANLNVLFESDLTNSPLLETFESQDEIEVQFSLGSSDSISFDDTPMSVASNSDNSSSAIRVPQSYDPYSSATITNCFGEIIFR